MKGLRHEGMLGGPRVVDFRHDDELGCDVTIRCNGVRFHIMVELTRLQGKGGKEPEFLKEYRDLVQAVRRDEEEVDEGLDRSKLDERKDLQAAEEQAPGAEAEFNRKDQVGTEDGCANDTSEHPKDGTTTPDRVTDREEGELKVQTESTISETIENVDEGEDGHEDPQGSLQRWILSPFKSMFHDLAPLQAPKDPTLHKYYHTEIVFFTLEVNNGELLPVELEADDDLHDSVAHLVPRLTVPKYVGNMKVTWISSNDIRVISESETPPPLHPAKVKVGNEIRFFKPVDVVQPSTTKRELKIFAKIEELNLRERMRVPSLCGLVGYADSRNEICGFLLESIESCTPLTEKLYSHIPASLRNKWSREMKNMVNILHDSGIVWGDAKADNALVDENDDLWMIDFGGSYTDGWVEPRLCETFEGDDQGLQKIVSALKNPDSNTFDPSYRLHKVRQGDSGRHDHSSGSEAVVAEMISGKRKREEACEEQDNPTLKKKRRNACD